MEIILLHREDKKNPLNEYWYLKYRSNSINEIPRPKIKIYKDNKKLKFRSFCGHNKNLFKVSARQHKTWFIKKFKHPYPISNAFKIPSPAINPSANNKYNLPIEKIFLQRPNYLHNSLPKLFLQRSFQHRKPKHNSW